MVVAGEPGFLSLPFAGVFIVASSYPWLFFNEHVLTSLRVFALANIKPDR